MSTPDPFDAEAMAEAVGAISCTAQDEQGMVTVTARPHGDVTEITVAPLLHNVGHETAAAEILAVVRTAQQEADREFDQRIQSQKQAIRRQLESGAS